MFPDKLVWNEELAKEVPEGWSVGTIGDEFKKLSKQSENLAIIRDALLPKLISGEIRIEDVESFKEVKVT